MKSRLFFAKSFALTFGLGLIAAAASAQPEIFSWRLNCNGATGYNGIIANVQGVQYNATDVYVTSSGIPSYTIGPFTMNFPTNQNYAFKFTRNPTQQTGAKTATPMGSIGVWVDGVPIFNAKDAISYNNRDVWHQNAIVWEALTFDACNGHGAPGMPSGGRYHHHKDPICLYTDNPLLHSPILGWAHDGFPVYGPRGFANADGTGGITRLDTSYRLRAITVRQTLPDGTVLAPINYGPTVAMTPLGAYVEDYEYIAGLGALDEHNGRFSVTPEYPAGIYHYVVTKDATDTPTYPYTFGPNYYGVVTLSMNQDHQMIPGGLTARTCASPTPSPTPSSTASVTPTASSTPSTTPSATPSQTPSPSPTVSLTPTSSLTPTISLTASDTPTISPTPTISLTPSISPTETPSLTPSLTPSPSATPSPTPNAVTDWAAYD